LSQSPTPKPSVALGVLLIVLAFAGVAVMSAFGKAASQVPTGALVFFQNFISLVLFAPWALDQGFGELRTSRIGLHMVRALGGLLSQVLMFVAVGKMSLVDAVLLSNSAPLFIPVVMRVWLKQRINATVWWSLLIGFAGVILILRPGLALLSNPSALIATSAALFSAIALVSVNQLSNTEPTRRILFYYFLFSSIAAAPFAVLHWKTPTGREWLYLAGVGIMMASSQLLIILAYQHATAERIAPFNYSVVIFSGLIGWLVWHNRPGVLALLGVLLVTAGGVLSGKFGGPGSQGHLGWLGYWNHLRLKTERDEHLRKLQARTTEV
jgi:drug/metabolite transporter (DMT)-like permease